MWYDKFCGLPYRHLGDNPETGIDCFNLSKLVLESQTDYKLPYSTKDFCDNDDERWYDGISKQLFNQFKETKWGWVSVNPKYKQTLDVATFYIGSTNVANHCAILVEPNKLLHIMEGKKSWVGVYGTHYLRYTAGIYRFRGIFNV
jgi:cell wall-associated NlpC family hydrolase